MERLSVLDEMFLHLEGPDTHMHVGAVAIFEGPPADYEDVLDTMHRRMHLVPRFRQKLAFVPFGLGRPVWVDDTHFNLEYHVRHTALPPPGDRTKLNRLAARIMSQQLDRSKPLWETWIVEGLAGGRTALISKTHHSLVDGVSGVDLMSVMFDVEREQVVIESEPWRPDLEPTSDSLMIDAIKERVTSPREAARSLQSAFSDPAGIPGRFVSSLRSLGEFVGGSFAAPASSVNQQVGPHRRFETVLADLDEFKAIKNRYSATVNDVVLAVVSGGLRMLLKDRGEAVDDIELRAMVPVSVRAEHEQGALGNRVASLWAALPLYERDPIKRLKLINAEMKDLKSSGQAVGAQLLTSFGEWVPPTIVAQASRLVARQRAFNLVITNVPGPQVPLYSLGRQMEEVYPVVPLTATTSVGVALFSYNGTIGFGLLGDYDTAPDLGVLAEGIEKSIAELASTV